MIIAIFKALHWLAMEFHIMLLRELHNTTAYGVE